MPLAVDEEEVTAEPAAGGPGLDRGQVDATDRELGKDLHQRAWMVVGQERRQRGPVRAGRCRQLPGRCHHDEPGHRVGPIVHVRREHGQPVLGRGEGACQRGVQASLGDPPGRLGVGGERHPLAPWQVDREPAAALRLGLRVAAYGLDVRQRGPGPGEQRELDRQPGFRADEQVTFAGQVVDGGGDDALDGTFYRHHGPLGLPGPDRGQGPSDRGIGHRLLAVAWLRTEQARHR
jgi:hypothetical protein